MLLSVRRQFIFVHIYKVAGESIKAALQPYAQPPLWERALWRAGITTQNQALYKLTWRFRKHAVASEIKAALPADIYQTYFKFAFVRNPWDWQVSLYHYILRDKYHPNHDLLAGMSGFGEYVEWRVENRHRLQKDFVMEHGELIVDFIGKYERLEQDFETVCKRLNLRATLPHKNRSAARRSYQSYYTETTRRLVADCFQEDIDYFGYTYES